MKIDFKKKKVTPMIYNITYNITKLMEEDDFLFIKGKDKNVSVFEKDFAKDYIGDYVIFKMIRGTEEKYFMKQTRDKITVKNI